MSTIIDLSDLGDRGFAIRGAVYDDAGFGVSSAGDVDGDGFDDMIVGAPYASISRPHSREGAAYVLFGHRGGFGTIDLGDLTGKDGFTVAGESVPRGFSKTGSSVSSAGDFNGDGYDDFLVGASLLSPHGVGAAYVIYGGPGGLTDVSLDTLAREDGFKIAGGEFDHAGTSVSAAGDVNGDGFDDVIIGSPSANGEEPYSGAAYVIFGSAGGYKGIDLEDLPVAKGFIIRGAFESDRAGYSVSTVEDINGDGLADVIVGAPNSADVDHYVGEAYVIYGKTVGFGQNGVIDLADLAPGDGFVIRGDPSAGRTGSGVSSAGDFNADGFEDMIVGAPGGNYNRGAAYVVFGKAGGFDSVDLSQLSSGAGFTMVGSQGGDEAGCSVASAGDVNGDGFDDVLVGARGVNGKDSYVSGEAYVIYGSASFSGTIDLAYMQDSQGFIIRSDGGNDQVGYSVAAAGDINGDGFDDVIVGAPTADDLGPQSGNAYVIYGAPPTEGVTREGTAIGNTIHGGAGDDVLLGRAGDDVLIGAAGGDLLNGQGGNDDVDGGDGDDRIIGGVGDDILHGGTGNDRLVGGRGADVLFGGQGKDALSGGEGADQFHFTATGSAPDVKGADRILDFFQASHDLIDLSDFDAKPGSPGFDPFTFIGAAAFSGAAGELRYEFSGDETLLIGDTDGDRASDFLVRLDRHIALTQADFLLTSPSAAPVGGAHAFLLQLDLQADPHLHLA